MMENIQNEQSTEKQMASDVSEEHIGGFYIYHIKNENMVTYLYGGASDQQNVELILKKRRSTNRYTFQVEWTAVTYWTAYVHASAPDLAKGTWDYDVRKSSGELGRVAVPNDMSFEQLAPLHRQATTGSRVLQPCEAKKGNV